MSEGTETLEQTQENAPENVQETTDSLEENDTGLEDTSVDDKDDSDNENDDDNIDLDSLSDDEFLEYLNKNSIDTTGTNTHEDEDTSKKSAPKNDNVYKDDKSFTNTNQKDNKKTVSTTESKNEQSVNTGIDYKSEYERIFKPFKANGKEITPKTVDDVISLMQMGANYTKKMQLLAPMKRSMETLNRAGIKEEDLSYLIDIYNGDTEAIKKLVKDKGIDIFNVDFDDIKYQKSTKNIASNEDVQFADTLMDINESIPKIQEIMNKEWDQESRKILLRDPNALRGLHEEIQLGRFDTIQSMVEREKTFGRFKGMPDIQIYSMLAKQYVEQQQQKQQQQQQKNIQNTSPSTPTKRSISDKRKAAPTAKNTIKSRSNLTVKDLLSMPEDEFLKLSERNLI